MSDYDDRTQLWNYRNNKVPGRHSGGSSRSSSQGHDRAKAYELYGEDQDNRHNDRDRPYQRNDRYSESQNRQDDGEARRDYTGYYDQDNRGYDRRSGRYGSDDRFGGRYGRDGSQSNRQLDDERHDRDYDYRSDYGYSSQPMWPSEFGFPPVSAAFNRDYAGNRRSSDDRNERGFFDRAGDEFLSWFGDRDATRRREQDHRGRGPKAYVRSDERIREDVNDRLTEDVWIDASNIDVSVSEGEVTLSGTVDDRLTKRRAEDVTDGITGVKHVQNNLRYGSTSNSTKTDSSL